MSQIWVEGRKSFFMLRCLLIGISAMMNLNTYLRTVANVRHDSETPEGYN